MSARRGGAARMISSWRRTDDVPADDAPAEAGLEGWISDLAGGETSVRRLRKRLEAMHDVPDPAPAAVPGDRDPLPVPDDQLAIDLVRLVG